MGGRKRKHSLSSNDMSASLESGGEFEINIDKVDKRPRVEETGEGSETLSTTQAQSLLKQEAETAEVSVEDVKKDVVHPEVSPERVSALGDSTKVEHDKSTNEGEDEVTVPELEEEHSYDTYPHLNVFPELNDEEDNDQDPQPDSTQIEDDVAEEAEDLVNTSVTFKHPEMSDRLVTSELDCIIYSDRTSSEFVPDCGHCFSFRNDPPLSLWDAES